MPFNYGEALQKSIYFYEAQQAGPLPPWNRVTWRGDSVLQDGADVGLDLSGGWFDAGDHVKFGFPMSYTATMLAWGAVEYRDAYLQAGQLDEFLNNLRFVNDYFIAAHPTPFEFYGQIAKGGVDHSFWGPPEVVDAVQPQNRVAFKIDLNCKGPDLAAETAAAMAASAMVFQTSDSAYAQTLLSHARDLYELALATTGTDGVENNYANCITDAKDFYNAGFGLYWDEMAWGAIWLWRATGEAFYLDRLLEFYPKMGNENQTNTPVFTWSQGWNDKAYGVYVLAANLIGDGVYHDDTQRYLDHWIRPTDQGGGLKTPGGVVVVDRFNGWGTMRYAANMAMLSLIYADGLGSTDPLYDRYHEFGKAQIDYILGDNPRNSSYMVGFGNNPPVNVHHRSSHGSWSNNIASPVVQRHILYGAVVGGPDTADDFNYDPNDRQDFRRNEVATDYNAGFTGAAARLYQQYGGEPLSDSSFPPSEGPFEEYLVGASTNSSGPRLIEIKAVIQNKSTAPAQVRDDLFFRYFVDLSEVFDAGLNASDVSITSGFNQASSISDLQVWGDPVDRLYYVEVSFAGVDIFPGGQSEFRREVQFRLSLPTSGNAPLWDNTNDPSWDSAYDTTTAQFGVKAPKIPVYGGNGELLFGEEPGPGCGQGTGINCIPTAQGSQLTTAFETPITVSLNGSDSDGQIVARTVIVPPTNGNLSGTGPSRTYTPQAGFFGTDSFSFIVTDDAGADSTFALVTINVETPIIPSINITAPQDGTDVETNRDFQLNYNLVNAAGVRISINGIFVLERTGAGPMSLTAPATAGSFSVDLTAIDSNGNTLNASDSILLNAVEPQPNRDPSACFDITSANPQAGSAVGFDAGCSTDPDNDALSYVWNFGDGQTGSGISPAHVYSLAGTFNVILTVQDGQGGTDSFSASISVAESTGGAQCGFTISDEWDTGFVAQISIANNGTETIDGWTVNWGFDDDSSVANLWNAELVGNNPYSASYLPWNRLIGPGQSFTFGFVGNKGTPGSPAPTVPVTGAICQ